MRRHRIFKASQGLCASCACRFAGFYALPALPTSTPHSISTRHFSTNDRDRLPFGIPAQPQDSTNARGDNAVGTPSPGSETVSSLSAAEQAEKSRRLEIARQREVAAQARQNQQQKREAARQAHFQTHQKVVPRQTQAQETQNVQRSNEERQYSNQQGSSRPPTFRTEYRINPRASSRGENAPVSSKDPVARGVTGGSQNSGDNASTLASTLIKSNFASRSGDDQKRVQNARGDARTPRDDAVRGQDARMMARSQPARNATAPSQDARSNSQSTEDFSPPKTAMPSFALRIPGSGGTTSRPVPMGWGSGGTAVKPVQYGDSSDIAKPMLRDEPSDTSQPKSSSASQPPERESPLENSQRKAALSSEGHWADLHDTLSPTPPQKEVQSVPFLPRADDSKSTPTEDDVASNWQHLRRQNPADSIPSNSPSKAATKDQPADSISSNSPSKAATKDQTPATPLKSLDLNEINNRFEAHQRERSTKQAGPPKVSYVPLRGARETSGEPSVPQTSQVERRCARCGQAGHIARFCEAAAAKPEPRSKESIESRDVDNSSDARTEEKRAGTSSTDDLARVEGRYRERVGERTSDRKGSKKSARNGNRGARREREEDDEDEEAGSREDYRRRKQERKAQKLAAREQLRSQAKDVRAAKKAEQLTPIALPTFISVQNLSQKLNIPFKRLSLQIENIGIEDVTRDMVLNSEVSGELALENNFDPAFEDSVEGEEDRDLKAKPAPEDKTLLPPRPPVVTIMGHVDHGKTTILDYLRKSSVAAGEAGGITQHIGAFSVALSSSEKVITFLDTPGHAAFLAMRQRGANVTDIVVLVVAADDSVKPQTLEALKHARGAGVPIIVAINKIDKPEADITRCKQDLARHGIEIEDFGGDTQVVCVSGKTGEGMDELEESILTLSEILDHRAQTDGEVEGWVLEATTKPAGRVATVLVRRGTLRVGDVLVAGKTWTRIRTLNNEAGQSVNEVGPGMPAEVDGWRDQPVAGDEVLQAVSEQKASSVIEFRGEKEDRMKMWQDIDVINKSRRVSRDKLLKRRDSERMLKKATWMARTTGVSVTEQLKTLQADVAEDDLEEDQDTAADEKSSGPISVPFIIKADVSGSVEAVASYALGVSSPLIAPTIVHSGVGPVHESDIDLADTVGANIIAFNLPQDPDMLGMAQALGIKIFHQNIIYRVIDDVKAVLEERLPAIVTQKVTGEAEISAVFDITIRGRKTMRIAGCKVRNGAVGMGARVRVIRGGEKVYDGTITSLKNVKKDVQEMRKGTECGMGFEDWQLFEVGDQIQTYEEVSEKRLL